MRSSISTQGVRVLLASPEPSFYYGDKFGWIADGLRECGCVVSRSHSAKDVIAREGDHDLVVFSHYNAGMNDSDLISYAPRRKARWVQWWWDLLVRDPGDLCSQELVRSFGPFMRVMDVVFVKERDYLKGYSLLGINARYLDQGCPGSMPAIVPPNHWTWDFVLFGAIYDGYRSIDAAALVSKGYKVAWAARPGSKILPRNVQPLEWTRPLDLPQLASKSRFVLSVDLRQNIAGYTSDRLWLATGMGACVMHRVFKHSRPVAKCLCYQSVNELLALAEQWKADRKGAIEFGQAAREYTLAGHTYAHRCRELVETALA